MIAVEVLALIPNDDPDYLALTHLLEHRMHPAIAAVIAHVELATPRDHGRWTQRKDAA